MNLSEKIVYYRKRAGMSQETLAEKLGVSRQAVSKWETGETVPELNKIVLLCKVFGISTDELLLEETEDEMRQEEEQPPQTASASNWVESVPGVIGRLLRRYGWLAGVYIAVSGLPLTLLGAAARSISKGMMNSFNASLPSMLGDLSGQAVYINGELVRMGTSSAPFNPVAALGGLIMGIGVMMMVGGTALAVALKKKNS